MKIITTLASGLLAVGLSAGFALAQAPAPGTAATAPGAAARPTGVTPLATAPKAKGIQKAASTPEGIECSAQADAQNKHGKDRVKFRKKCIADLKKAAGGKAAAPKAAVAAPVTTPAAGAPAKK